MELLFSPLSALSGNPEALKTKSMKVLSLPGHLSLRRVKSEDLVVDP